MSNPVMFCDFLKKSYDIVGIVNVMALSSLFILMTQYGLDYPYFYEKEDGESGAKDDLKMEEQIVGNRNDSTGVELPKKPSFNLFRDASGQSRSLTPGVDLKAKSINLLYILLVPSTTKITMKIKLMFTKSWISFLRSPLPLDICKEVLVSLHQAVIPQLSNPIMLCDFLTRSYDIGGVVSVMALSSLFILMMQHGLEHRYFYEKLLGSCLTSPLLPVFLAAAFAKKLSGLALSVLQLEAPVIVATIYSLFRRHPSINYLVHRDGKQESFTIPPSSSSSCGSPVPSARLAQLLTMALPTNGRNATARAHPSSLRATCLRL